MRLRDEIEAALRSWDFYERNRDAPPVIDYDCHPSATPSVSRRRAGWMSQTASSWRVSPC